jgi:hypothetical protein
VLSVVGVASWISVAKRVPPALQFNLADSNPDTQADALFTPYTFIARFIHPRLRALAG